MVTASMNGSNLGMKRVILFPGCSTGSLGSFPTHEPSVGKGLAQLDVFRTAVELIPALLRFSVEDGERREKRVYTAIHGQWNQFDQYFSLAQESIWSD